MMKRIYAHPEHCVNCHLCKVYCITAHSKSKDVVKAYKKENLGNTARVIIEENAPTSFALQCRHCDEPQCVASCIGGAMQKDPPTGIVFCDTSRCVGCLTCVVACPFGAVVAGPDGKALKCDLCKDLDLDQPACVANCPNEALSFIEKGEKRNKR